MGDYIAHYGIKGQEWGNRRWQYKDGSLTPAGRLRYGYGQQKKKKGFFRNLVDKKTNWEGPDYSRFFDENGRMTEQGRRVQKIAKSQAGMLEEDRAAGFGGYASEEQGKNAMLRYLADKGDAGIQTVKDIKRETINLGQKLWNGLGNLVNTVVTGTTEFAKDTVKAVKIGKSEVEKLLGIYDPSDMFVDSRVTKNSVVPKTATQRREETLSNIKTADISKNPTVPKTRSETIREQSYVPSQVTKNPVVPLSNKQIDQLAWELGLTPDQVKELKKAGISN